MPGETVSKTIPDWLIVALLAAEVRAQRDAMLRACDWTQGADSPLDATAKTQWAAYRQALRNVPQQSEFPNEITWPTAPTGA